MPGIYLMLTVSLPVLICIILCFVVCSIVLLERTGTFQLLFIYSVAVIVAISTNVYQSHNVSDTTHAGVFNFFIIPEFIILVYYIRKHVSSDAVSRFLLFLHQAFPVIVAYILLYSEAPGENKPVLIVVHYFILLIVCLVYYYNMLSHPPAVQLTRFPPFWIVTGIISCCLFSVTTVMFANGFAASLFARTCAYSLLFLCFFIALTCQLKIK